MSYALFLAAPKFTSEDEEKEQAELTSEEKLQARADLYGTSDGSEASEGQILEGLSAMRRALFEIPEKEKKQYLVATGLGCEMTDSEDNLRLFLRSENYDGEKAAWKLVRYWERRVRLFGSELAFEQLSDASVVLDRKEDRINFDMNHITAPGKDAAGRSILLSCPKKKTGSYNRESTLRVIWVKCHQIIRYAKDPCRPDFVFVVWAGGARVDQLIDRKYQKTCIDDFSMMPLRLSAIHVCHLPSIFAALKPVIFHFYGSRLRQRFVLHSGTDDEIFASLSEYGLPRFESEVEILHPQLGSC